MNILSDRIQKILDDHVARGVVGMSLAISLPGEETLLFQSGLADKFRQTPMHGDHLFRIASCTKSFIAAGLHLLVEDGHVDLDEPVTRWFPDLPNAALMPVRTLLNHRSGLPDAEAFMPLITDKIWTGPELVDFAFRHVAQKAPWHGMEYCGTGYILAGLIIEHETGKPYSEHLRDRILTPLAMNDTWFGTYEAFPVGRLARGYMHADDKPLQREVNGDTALVGDIKDATEWFPLSGANAAGDMISTPRDVVTFLNALFDGRILGAKQLFEMKDNVDTAFFPGSAVIANGCGFCVMRYGDSDLKGHLGQIPGHTSIMGRDEKSGVTLMLVQNSGATDFEGFFLKGVNEPVGYILEAVRDTAS